MPYNLSLTLVSVSQAAAAAGADPAAAKAADALSPYLKPENAVGARRNGCPRRYLYVYSYSYIYIKCHIASGKPWFSSLQAAAAAGADPAAAKAADALIYVSTT